MWDVNVARLQNAAQPGPARLDFVCSFIRCKFVSIRDEISLFVRFASLGISLRVLICFLSPSTIVARTQCVVRAMAFFCVWWLNAFAVVMQDNKLSLVIGIMCNLNGYPNIYRHTQTFTYPSAKSDGNGNSNGN